MSEPINIIVDKQKLEKSVIKLINDLNEDPSKDIKLHQGQNIWDIFEELDTESFYLLKKNVYFADWLRSISYSLESNAAHDIKYNTSDKAEIHDVEENLEIEVVDDVLSLPSLDTKLYDVDLPGRFLKLINRLRAISQGDNEFILGDKLSDLISIPNDEVYKLSGVGKSYCDVLDELKLLYTDQNVSDLKNECIEVSSEDVSEIRLNYAGIEKNQIKALDKLARYLEVSDLSNEIWTVLNIEKKDLESLLGFGTGIVSNILKFKVTLKEEVRKVLEGDIDLNCYESKLLIPKYIGEIPIEKFGELLLEDVDSFLDKIKDNESNIIQKRWGFVDKKKTLEEIGSEYNVTRERIRQIEKKVTEKLPRNLRFNTETIWQFLEPALTPRLPQEFSDLYSCFNDDSDFYDFLGVVSGKGNLEEYISPTIKPDLLNQYFSERGAPISYVEIKEYLTDSNLYNVKSIDNAILYLVRLGRIRISEGKVWPLQLGKSEASAFVLASHPRGLPYSDVATLVNSNKYSKTEIYTERLDTEAFNDPDYIFLSGKGVYKHTRFINFDLLSPEAIFQELVIFSDKINRTVFHLNESYQYSSLLKKQDYYVIRHIVKNYGEEFGFFFSGKSQTDSVGLKKGFKNITQRDVILEAMKTSSKPLTNPQIASLLKSKSSNHASYYLDSMIKSEEVVQVDRMLYTIPEIAYKNIDMSVYIEAIYQLLVECDKPVDPSIFKEILNIRLSVNYSKYFYSSIARKHANEQGWYRKHSLYSATPISYKNLHDAVDVNCSLEDSNEQNISTLLRFISITPDTASVAISSWRSNKL